MLKPFFRPSSLFSSSWWDGLIILCITIGVRYPFWGNPALHVDEQFYLFVGDRIWQGALPYVDIWDRKPIGLFLLYAAIRLLGGDGVIQYQLVATGFVLATAWLLYSWLIRLGSRISGLLAAIFYVVWLNLFQGWGGQSPVFYNLLVVSAAWLTFRELIMLQEAPSSARQTVLQGAGVMFLLGLALQLKYSIVIEGVAFGCVLLWVLAQKTRWSFPAIGGAILFWPFIALIPTLLAAGFYASKGEFQAFFYANFLSILQKNQASALESWPRVQAILVLCMPLVIPTILFFLSNIKQWHFFSSRKKSIYIFFGIWIGAATIGVGVVGNYYFHYILPLIVPLSLSFGWCLAEAQRQFPQTVLRIRSAALIILLIGAIGSFHRDKLYRTTFGSGVEAKALVLIVDRYLGSGCLYVFDGPPILYHLTKACLPTRYPFPYHLNAAIEANALGIDPVTEIQHIFKVRPSVVVTANRPAIDPNQIAWVTVHNALAQHYYLAARKPFGRREIFIYVERSHG